MGEGLPSGAIAPVLPRSSAPAVFGQGETDVDPRALLTLYHEGRFDEVTGAFLRVFDHFEKRQYQEADAVLQERIDRFVSAFLYIMARPDFRVPDRLSPLVVCYNHIIANLVAISSFRTTDPQVRMLMAQKGNFVKLLMLYSPRNTVRLDEERFFEGNALLASLWYMMTPIGAGGGVTATVRENLRRHVATLNERFIVPDERIAPIYFLATNFDPDRDGPLKQRLNAQIRERFGGLAIDNRPDPASVAIVTAKWFPTSAVYRSCRPFIERLARRRRLTLVHLGPVEEQLDTSLFAQTRRVILREGKAQLDEVVRNDFQLVYYPDVGMNPESIWLSNARLAPIQAMGYGHPVSTFGSQIDYFIGGADVELVDLAERNYSERLVLIPGIGAHPVFPNYVPQRPSRPASPIAINCAWGFAKINEPMVRLLRAIRDRATRPVRFQFFPAWSLGTYNAMVPFRREIGEALGHAAVVVANQSYDVYMGWMEQGHLSIDAYPFGGYNTIVDSLHVARPIVTFEGDRFYNRAASALLRRLDLEELVAHDEREYVEKTLRLVEDDVYREGLSARLATMDLRTRIYDTGEPEAFERAIDFLIEHHESLAQDGTHSPIFIQ